MRDILLASILFLALPVAFFRPFLAVSGFTWISLMNPHRLTWGFAYSMPFAQLYAVAALFSVLVFESKLLLSSIRLYWAPLVYLAWMLVSTIFSVSPEKSWFLLGEVAKVHLMCLLTIAVISDKKRLNWILVIIVASIAFYGVKGGIYTISTGGNGRVWGPTRTAIADNNHLAAALVCYLPLIYWMKSVVTARWAKWLILAGMGLIAVSILGSQSRGAFVATLAIGLSLAVSDKNKIRTLIVVVLLGLATMSFMPEKYWNRIDTINTYKTDNSAQGRLHTWKIATRIANHRATGAGFSYYGSWIYKKYADDPNDIHSSHSIYFQALGEHGWIGFVLFLLILASFANNCRLLRKLSIEDGDEDSERLSRMMQVSLIGFCVSGMFVNIGNWDGFYYVYAALLAAVRLKTRQNATQSDATPVGLATTPSARRRLRSRRLS